jgi:hypothetical protein
MTCIHLKIAAELLQFKLYIDSSFSLFADTRLQLATRIGACLGIVKTKADYFCNSYKPAVKITTSSFMAGRVSLPRNVETVTMLDRYVNCGRQMYFEIK